jgi:hypothetical protein
LYSRRKKLLKPSRALLRTVTVDAVDRREKEEKMDEGLCGRPADEGEAAAASAVLMRCASLPRLRQDVCTVRDSRLGSVAVLTESRGGRAESDCELFAADGRLLDSVFVSVESERVEVFGFEASGRAASFAAAIGAGDCGMLFMHSAGKCESGTPFARARSSSWPSSQSSSTSRANTASWYSASSKTPSVFSSVVSALAHRLSTVRCGSRGEGPTSGMVQSSRMRLRLIVLTVSNSTSNGSKYAMASVGRRL